MTLRKKTLIIVGLTTIILLLVLSVVSWRIMLGSVAEVEERQVRRSVQRVLNALSSELATLDSIVADWAAWDDTYVFVQDGNQEYVRSNLVDSTFANGRFNVMLFVDYTGEIVFGKAFDLHANEEVPIPNRLQEYLAEGTLVTHTDTQSSITGILMLPEAPMLVASRPILTSEDEGPILGTLIMGRYLDAAEFERLAEVVHLPLALYRLDDSRMPPDFHTAYSSLSAEDPIFVQPLDRDSIAGYALLEDIYGEPSLVLRVEKPRDLYRQGRISLFHFLLSLLVVGLTFGLLIDLHLEKAVLSRLVQLSADVSSIGQSGDLSTRVSGAGGDELSNVAEAINGMLETLERSREQLRESKERYRILFNSGSDLIFVSQVTDGDALGGLTEVNRVAWRKLMYAREELLRLSIPKVLDPEGGSDFPALVERLMSEGQILYEAAAVAKDGTRIPVEVNAHVFDFEGQLAVLSIARDITERRRADEALRRLLEFEAVLTKLATSFIYLPPDEIDHGVHQALQVISELAGADRSYVFLLSEDRLHLDRTYEWCAPDIEPHVDGLRDSPVQWNAWWMDKLERFETICVPLVVDLPPDARVAGVPWLLPATQSLVVIPMVSGGSLVGFLGVSAERSERTWEDVEINLLKTMAGMLAIALVQKQAEEALRRSEQRFRDVTHVTGDWIWEVDAEGRYTYASPVVEQVLGYTPDEVIGKHCYDFMPSDGREELKSQAEEIFGRKSLFIKFVSPRLHKEGHIVILETTGLPLTNRNGDLLGYRGADHDITEARRLEEDLDAVQMLGQELVLSRDKQQVALATVDGAKLLLRSRMCELWLVDDEAGELVCQARAPRSQAHARDTLPLDGEWNVVGAVARDGKAIYVPDLQKDPRFADSDSSDLKDRSKLCVPLEVGGQVIGVLLAVARKPYAFDEGERQLVSTLASQAALAVENARLYGWVRAGRDRLRALSRRLVEVQEAERRHIARELHDEVGQLLTGLRLLMEMGMRSPADAAKDNLNEAQALVNEIMARVRKLSLDLRPTMLDDLGLLPALLWHIERYTSQTSVRVDFRHTGLEGQRFAPEVETAAYRIVQEALTNVARHAGVSEAAVRAWCDQDVLSIRVEDRGVGFAPEAVLNAGASTGLSGMYERVALLGGQLAIEATPGTGVCLTAEIPLVSSSEKQEDV